MGSVCCLLFLRFAFLQIIKVVVPCFQCFRQCYCFLKTPPGNFSASIIFKWQALNNKTFQCTCNVHTSQVIYPPDIVTIISHAIHRNLPKSKIKQVYNPGNCDNTFLHYFALVLSYQFLRLASCMDWGDLHRVGGRC